VTAALKHNRENHQDNRNEAEEPRPLKESHDESNVAHQEQGYEDDVEQQIEARLVIARIPLPLPPKQFRRAHEIPRCAGAP
jgi:hypothetical protein